MEYLCVPNNGFKNRALWQLGKSMVEDHQMAMKINKFDSVCQNEKII